MGEQLSDLGLKDTSNNRLRLNNTPSSNMTRTRKTDMAMTITIMGMLKTTMMDTTKRMEMAEEMDIRHSNKTIPNNKNIMGMTEVGICHQEEEEWEDAEDHRCSSKCNNQCSSLCRDLL